MQSDKATTKETTLNEILETTAETEEIITSRNQVTQEEKDKVSAHITISIVKTTPAATEDEPTKLKLP